MVANSKEMKHVFLIDGSGFLFRAFFGIKAQMNRPDGTPTNAVYGFTQMLLKLVDDTDADHIAVIFDRARKTFRNDIYKEYKSHRPPPPDDLIPQFELVREATRAMNIPAIDMEGYEADDLIATYAKQAVAAGADVTVVSTDKDLMQVVGPKIKMFDAMKNREIGLEQVVEKFGVKPDRVIDVQALAGDSSDNVPGVAGIGVKTAALLIEEYGDLDEVLANAEKIKQPKRREALIEQADLARISRELVTLKDDVPVEVPLKDFAVKEIEPDILLGFLQEQAFKSLVTRLESKLGVKAPEATAPIEKAEPKTKKSAKKPSSSKPNPAAFHVATAFPENTEYELVQDKKSLQVWIEDAESVGMSAVDTETTSLDSMQAELVGISMSVHPGKACYIPVAHTAPVEQVTLDLGLDDAPAAGKGNGAIKQIKRDEAIKLIKPLLENPSVLKIGQNMKYDAEIFARYGITTPLTLYHEHNAVRAAPRLLRRLENGAAVALVSDAGTPLISDPGYRLVRQAQAAEVQVFVAPGACAPIAALIASGLPSDRFLFAGFLPTRQSVRRKALAGIAGISASLVFLESPRRLAQSLSDMKAVLGDREAAVARELTKRYEEVVRGSLEELAARYTTAPTPKGEAVVIVGPPDASSTDNTSEKALDEELRRALATMSVRDAARTVSIATGRSRSETYRRALLLSNPAQT